MKKVMRTPALVYGRTKGARKDRFILCAPEFSYEIQECSESDAPIAMITRAYEESQEFRYFDGKFYAKHPDPDAALARHEMIFASDHPTFRNLNMKILQSVSGLDRDMTYPKDLATLFHRVDRGGINMAAVSAVQAEISETRRVVDDLKEWRELAEAEMAKYLVIDGVLWNEVYEPCYVFNRRKQKLDISSLEIYDPNRQDRFYGHLDIRHIPAKGDDTLGPLEDVRIDVLMPEVCTDDLGLLEEIRIANTLIKYVTDDMLQTCKHRKKNPLRVYPQEVVTTFLEMKETLGQNEEAINTAIARFINACLKNSEKVEPLLGIIFVQEISEFIEDRKVFDQMKKIAVPKL